MAPTAKTCRLDAAPRFGSRLVECLEWGSIPYIEGLEKQRQLWRQVYEQEDNGSRSGYFIFAEHPTTITMGKREKGEGLKVSRSWLEEQQIPCVAIERGGKATLHSPGQLVVYFIVPLHQWNLTVRCFVAALEKAMAATCSHFGIGGALPGAENNKPVGAWISNKKIGQVGIGVNRGITIHGLAFNVANDLALFSLIDPCGLGPIEITSMSKELTTNNSVCPSMTTVQTHLRQQLLNLLHCQNNS